MSNDPKPGPEHDPVQQHIRKAVGISALRRIRGLVDEYEEEKRYARLMTPIGITLVCLAVVGVLVTLFVFKFAPTERAAVSAVTPGGAPRPLRVERGAYPESPVLTQYGVMWAVRIENTGAKALPQVIRDKALYGSTTLSTYMRAEDATIERIEVTKPSAYPELDEIAQKLVMRAAPFPSFPDNLKKQAGTIKITREFHFAKE